MKRRRRSFGTRREFPIGRIQRHYQADQRHLELQTISDGPSFLWHVVHDYTSTRAPVVSPPLPLTKIGTGSKQITTCCSTFVLGRISERADSNSIFINEKVIADGIVTKYAR